MRDRHPTKHRRHVAAKAHVELILGNDELMFKQVAAYIAFSPKFVACLAETFTRHAREIAEGLRGPLLQVELEKKEYTGRKQKKNNRPREDEGWPAGDDMHLFVNSHVSDATALPLSSLPPSHEALFIIQRGKLDERGTRVL